MGDLKNIILLVILSLGAIDDYRRMKIDNLIILFGIISAGYFRCSLPYGDIFSLLKDAALPVVVLFFFYCTGGLGAGDIKLISVVSLFTGFENTLYVIFFSGCAGLVLYAAVVLSGQKPGKIRFAFPILIGTFCGMIYRGL